MVCKKEKVRILLGVKKGLFSVFLPESTPALNFMQQLTLLNNCKLLIHAIKHELCLLIMKQVTAVWLQNGLKCTV